MNATTLFDVSLEQNAVHNCLQLFSLNVYQQLVFRINTFLQIYYLLSFGDKIFLVPLLNVGQSITCNSPCFRRMRFIDSWDSLIIEVETKSAIVFIN